jgi:hypothetical protein
MLRIVRALTRAFRAAGSENRRYAYAQIATEAKAYTYAR